MSSALPPDIQKVAERVYAQLGRGPDDDEQAIAKAIMAERERCAKHLRDGCTIEHGEPADHAIPEILHAIREGF